MRFLRMSTHSVERKLNTIEAKMWITDDEHETVKKKNWAKNYNGKLRRATRTQNESKEREREKKIFCNEL